MVKKLWFVFLAGCFVFSALSISFAQKAKADTQEKVKAVDVGNKICPVSGEKIDEKAKSTYEYNGKIYNFCCPACIEAFKNEPEKSIKKVDEELKSLNTQKTDKVTTPEKSSMPMETEDGEGHPHHHY